MIVIGITGPIASGKSTVDAILRDAGVTLVIDADHTVHQLLRADPAIQAAILETFGPAVQAPDGSIDRRLLGAVVFQDPAALRQLEGILYPAVRRHIREAVTAQVADAVVVIDAVKLLEGELATLVQSVWWVTARPEQQLQRLKARGFDEAAARARLEAQPLLSSWEDRVHVIIDNSGDVHDTRSQVLKAYEDVLAAHHPGEACQ